MLLLDSDIVIDVLRRHPPAVQWLGGVTEVVAIPGYVALEATAGARDARELQAVDSVLARLRVVWASTGACDTALQVFRQVRLSTAIGALDVLIAHTALELGLPLHTFDRKHYAAIPNLVTIQPYTR